MVKMVINRKLNPNFFYFRRKKRLAEMFPNAPCQVLSTKSERQRWQPFAFFLI